MWDARCKLIYQIFKIRLTEAPVLTAFYQTQPLSLHKDALTLGFGAVLYQVVKNEKSVLVYSSHCLNIQEKNYGIPKFEALTIIWAIKNRHYLLGCHFKIVMDHHSLQSEIDMRSEGKAGQMDARWQGTSMRNYTRLGFCMWIQMPRDARFKQELKSLSTVCVTVAIDEIDQWDDMSSKA